MSLWTWIAAKVISSKIDLKEGPMDETKRWYQSRGVWTGIVTVLIGLYSSVGTTLMPALGHSLPAIPEWIYALLGTLNIYTRVTADTKIG